jgi:hypothetical protein
MGAWVARLINGAARIARALANWHGKRSCYIERPATAAKDGCSLSLFQARNTVSEGARAAEGSVKGEGFGVFLSKI